MTRWWAVAGLAGAVLLALLSLSRASRRAIGTGAPDGSTRGRDTRRSDDHGRSGDHQRLPSTAPLSSSDDERPPSSARSASSDDEPLPATAPAPSVDRPEHVPERITTPREATGGAVQDAGTAPSGSASAPDSDGRSPAPRLDAPERTTAVAAADGSTRLVAGGRSPSSRFLLVNVAFTQGLFAAVVAGGLWLFEVPATAVGLVEPTAAHLAAGLGLGTALYIANEVGAAVADRAGLGHDERLRELLAPEGPVGWAVLLLVVLPVVAGFEELLFRGVLVGALSTGFGVSPWLLAAASSVAFGLGHGAQGRAGVAVTGALGFVLAAAYVLTGSLLAVVLAHYLVNALEFVVHEGLDLAWGERLLGG